MDEQSRFPEYIKKKRDWMNYNLINNSRQVGPYYCSDDKSSLPGCVLEGKVTLTPVQSGSVSGLRVSSPLALDNPL